jgi:hypothetical protein
MTIMSPPDWLGRPAAICPGAFLSRRAHLARGLQSTLPVTTVGILSIAALAERSVFLFNWRFLLGLDERSMSRAAAFASEL